MSLDGKTNVHLPDALTEAQRRIYELEAKEKERRQISTDLHDHIGQLSNVVRHAYLFSRGNGNQSHNDRIIETSASLSNCRRKGTLRKRRWM